ncbi:methyl-accepting chemotaxis protein [Halocynthiibacter sp. C4]|uniref:methyl-accepting chemotaxis protein n=1 Tax=Halocynthiibacter sp. C4 TaxID=2992758 RepID=UPI00237C0752|nr:methyl-accepting chemotaxis protein [Halocynthiibacter sp. C4]MDE0588741.1 methyl-accepting chemotaxis protein [Halocynthiibacter sp. C4]
MSLISSLRKSVGSFRSVFFRVSAIMAVCTAAVAGTMAYMSYVSSKDIAENNTRAFAQKVTTFSASQSASAIRFGNKEALDSIVKGAVSSSQGSALDSLVLNLKSEVIYSHENKDLGGTELYELAAKAVSSGAAQTSADGFQIAMPAFFGKSNDLVGAIAFSWTPELVLAEMKKDQIQTLLIAAAVFLIALVSVMFVLRALLSKPLVQVRHAMEDVAKANYEAEVPSQKRNDEIGDIARSLEEFRQTLQDAEKSARESQFKGAAFESSSSAMMMVNKELRINYVNSAFFALLKDNEAALPKAIRSSEINDIIGKPYAELLGGDHSIERILSDTDNLPHISDIVLDDVRISQSINIVHDARGAPIGRVIEWKDVTEERLNRAILTSLDASQARVEFQPDGKVIKANDNFCSVVERTEREVSGKQGQDLLPQNELANRDDTPMWNALANGQSVVGRFNYRDGSGKTAIFDGSFSPVVDREGNVSRIVMIANDVTTAQLELQTAEETRAKMEAEQSAVVDGLRVGLKKLSNGDLSAKIEKSFAPEYEQLRNDFNHAIEALCLAMTSVVENSNMIRNETGEISKAADDLSRRTETQAATLEETAAALEEMTSSVSSAADGAALARKMVTEARDNAEASGDVVREAVTAMSEIASSSQQISKITGVIDDIAFQTNLLALNAGVEAARAGDAGRGFAVVATEVRDLAQRSSDAAREINGLISTSENHVKRGVDLVDQTGDALKGIFDRVSEISSHVAEIAVSAEEQSRGLAEINTAVNQLDQVTQQNAAMFEETTAASHALTGEAENLANTMAQFNTGNLSPQVSSPIPISSPPSPGANSVAVKSVVNGSSLPDRIDDGWEDF